MKKYVEIDRQGLTRVKKQLNRDYPNIANKASFIIASQIEARAKTNLASNKSQATGKLQQSIFVEPIKKNSYKVIVAQNYGKFVEFGRGTVRPKRKKMLFIPLTLKAKKQGWSESLKRGQDYVLAFKAKPSKPKPFFYPAVKFVKKDAKNILKKLIKNS